MTKVRSWAACFLPARDPRWDAGGQLTDPWISCLGSESAGRPSPAPAPGMAWTWSLFASFSLFCLWQSHYISTFRTCSHYIELIYNPLICPLIKQTNKKQHSLVQSVVAVGDSNLTSDVPIERNVLKSQPWSLSYIQELKKQENTCRCSAALLDNRPVTKNSCVLFNTSGPP